MPLCLCVRNGFEHKDTIEYFFQSLKFSIHRINLYMRVLRVIVLFLFLAKSASLLAQDTRIAADTSQPALSDIIASKNMPVIIGEINLSGNKKTKSPIVLREIPFLKGERLV